MRGCNSGPRLFENKENEMLAPAKEDPNRSKELERRKSNPQAFGSDAEKPSEVAKRDLSGHNHKVIITESDTCKDLDDAETAALAEWNEYLNQPVADIVAELANFESVDLLLAMRVAEENNKNRSGLLAAIDKELKSRQ
jgi:hypothetical protein